MPSPRGILANPYIIYNDNGLPDELAETMSICVICCVQMAGVVMMPCNHKCVCPECWEEFDRLMPARLCPECRLPAEPLRVFSFLEE